MEAQLNPIEQACEAVGSARELARRLIVKPPTISQWAKGFDVATGLPRSPDSLPDDARPVPKDRCPAVEFETRGSVAVERLRADVRWVRVPDPNWPHPGGRPLIDVFGPAAEVSHVA